MRLVLADPKVLGVISTVAGLKSSLLGYSHFSLQFLAKGRVLGGTRNACLARWKDGSS